MRNPFYNKNLAQAAYTATSTAADFPGARLADRLCQFDQYAAQPPMSWVSICPSIPEKMECYRGNLNR
jgi:hypothetical protein